MAKLIILQKQHSKNRRHITVNDLPGQPRPLYLGSKYDGEEVSLVCLVEGTDYNDAKSYIDSLSSQWESQEEMTFGPPGEEVTGKIARLSYSLVPNKALQRVVITLNTY